MKIYLFRHAEKASLFHPNPGLSQGGERQAQRLAERVRASEMPRPTQLWVSPKKRAQLSFQPLAEQYELRLDIKEALDEKRNDENRESFRARIGELCRGLAGQEGIIYVCTHIDWLEESMDFFSGERSWESEIPSHWSPLQYLALQEREGLFDFIEQKRIPL